MSSEGLTIAPAESAQQVLEAQELFVEYAQSLGFSLCFQGFDEELAGLPGKYAPPAGRLLLARFGEQLAGCVALQPIDARTCEMKRLYVRPAFRSRGVGRALAEAIVEAGRALGYRTMKLDTLASMTEALTLYRSLGFEEAPAYRFNPLNGVVYMALRLAPAHVFKISGSELDDAVFSQRFAARVADAVRAGAHVAVVHGGGKELTALLKAFQIESRFVNGLRVTDAQTRDAALMVLAGLANKRLVAALLAEGVDAIGVCGVDRALVRVRPLDPALHFVGKPASVRSDVLDDWLRRKIVPVIAPMSIGEDGQMYNVNADDVAAAIASAIDADMLTFVTNVPAVLDSAGAPIAALTVPQAESLIAQGVIFGGMIPKVRAALETVQHGVKQARITDLDGMVGQAGTVFVAGESGTA
ncbi:MAG: acetylglutamate kinase [Anaerolineae bacterium]|nr:acetylglutamate kinase [Thermoflexales bacterium]MDW8408365.1 acetylglutamate kinase [Anaerolineae bacterium]